MWSLRWQLGTDTHSWALDGTAVDVINDVMGVPAVDAAAHRLRRSQDLLDRSCRGETQAVSASPREPPAAVPAHAGATGLTPRGEQTPSASCSSLQSKEHECHACLPPPRTAATHVTVAAHTSTWRSPPGSRRNRPRTSSGCSPPPPSPALTRELPGQ